MDAHIAFGWRQWYHTGMKAVFVAFVAASVLVATGCGNSSNRRGAAAADSAPVYAPAAQEESVLEVSFDFVRQRGFASNQFAVWIEDAEGRYVRTLYATRWTAAGGWQRRETSIPQWVSRSGLAGRDRAHVDALAGPTPQSGTLTYLWDGKDYDGRAVPAGEFRVFVEGTLRWENQVLYTAIVRLDEAGRVNAAREFFGDGDLERDMVGPVTVTVRP